MFPNLSREPYFLFVEWLLSGWAYLRWWLMRLKGIKAWLEGKCISLEVTKGHHPLTQSTLSCRPHVMQWRWPHATKPIHRRIEGILNSEERRGSREVGKYKGVGNWSDISSRCIVWTLFWKLILGSRDAWKIRFLIVVTNLDERL